MVHHDIIVDKQEKRGTHTGTGYIGLVQSDHVDNTALRSENEMLKKENLAFSEMLKNAICPTCDDHPPVGEEEIKLNIERLRRENTKLREEHERISNEITSKTGIPISRLLSLPPGSLERLLSSPAENLLSQQSGSSSIGPCADSPNSHKRAAIGKPTEMSEDAKIMVVQMAGHALNVLAELLLTVEPFWVLSPRYILNNGNYFKVFPKSRHLKCRTSRIESSRDLVEVPIAASDLVEMFLDAKKWEDLFPTIVKEAKIIETLDTGSLGGSLNLMYERTHILSSLVAPREFVFLRYCRQLNPGSWFIMDASYDCSRKVEDTLGTYSWKLPSGLMIEGLSNGKSKVTWVDHVEVDESLNHPLYRNLLSSVHGYGAKRWLSTLERTIERSLYSALWTSFVRPGSTSSRELGEGINSLEGRRKIMTLSHRMIRDFCAILSMRDGLDLSQSANDKVKLSVRDNNEPGQPHGMIVSASTSIWLPRTFENIFNFLRDEYRRPEWDIMLNQRPVSRIANVPTGTHPGNCVSIIKPNAYNEQMLLLQESSIDTLGALVVFATMNKQAIASVMDGGDPSKIPMLPCGFVISSDGISYGKASDGASTSTGIGRRPSGSLLTLTYQLGVTGNSASPQNHKEAANVLDTLVGSIIQKLKVALRCPQLD